MQFIYLLLRPVNHYLISICIKQITYWLVQSNRCRQIPYPSARKAFCAEPIHVSRSLDAMHHCRRFHRIAPEWFCTSDAGPANFANRKNYLARNEIAILRVARHFFAFHLLCIVSFVIFVAYFPLPPASASTNQTAAPIDCGTYRKKCLYYFRFIRE